MPHPSRTGHFLFSYFCGMLLLHRTSTDPWFNIAAEEYLIKNTDEPLFMLWQNRESVIVGKHQNPLREVNLKFTNQQQIPIIRRISGGGTVYHDLGNLNYSFIDFGKAEHLVNFVKYSKPILQLLHQLQVDAGLSGKSDLKIKGKKFSGNASHVYKNRVLHHGTLLFNSNLDILNESIKIDAHQITDKAVNSNRSLVTNIQDHLPFQMSLPEFKTKLIDSIKNLFPDIKECSLTHHQIAEIQKLATEKYKTWEWNFGYSPRYTISGYFDLDGIQKEIKIEVEKGFINDIECEHPQLTESRINRLKGIQHEQKSIQWALRNFSNENWVLQLFKILF
jgi:lipoate-protein ligase A